MKSAIALTSMAVAAATFACSIFLGGPAYPNPTITVPTSTAADLESEIERALTQNADTGTLTLTITEDQLTAYLAAQLAEQTDPVLTDPRVFLRDGAVELVAKAQSGLVEGNVRVIAHVLARADGLPEIQIVEADLGPVPMPDSLKEGISSFLQETLTGSLGPAAIGFRLEGITVGDGQMTVTGRLK
jgi:hypothetical protein